MLIIRHGCTAFCAIRNAHDFLSCHRLTAATVTLGISELGISAVIIEKITAFGSQRIQCGLQIFFLVTARTKLVQIQQSNDSFRILTLGIVDGGLKYGIKLPLFLLPLMLLNCIVVLLFPLVSFSGNGIEVLAVEAF